jgi:hypothetical protein
MKTLKLSAPLAFILMCSLTSCPGHNCPPESDVYSLTMSFQDTAGNDLVKGIKLEEWFPGNVPMEEAQSGSVKSDLYTLDIIISEPCKNFDTNIFNFPARPGVIPDDNSPKLGWSNDYYHKLSIHLRFPADDCPEIKKITYRLKCPYIFGDNETHELVTYWHLSKRDRTGEIYGECYRIEFNGKVFQVTNEQFDWGGHRSVATIIVEM